MITKKQVKHGKYFIVGRIFSWQILFANGVKQGQYITKGKARRAIDYANYIERIRLQELSLTNHDW